MLDGVAAEYEKESLHGRIGPIKARRPHISDKVLTTISVRLSQSLLRTIQVERGKIVLVPSEHFELRSRELKLNSIPRLAACKTLTQAFKSWIDQTLCTNCFSMRGIA